VSRAHNFLTWKHESLPEFYASSLAHCPLPHKLQKGLIKCPNWEELKDYSFPRIHFTDGKTEVVVSSVIIPVFTGETAEPHKG
jgi:hypothetical protein